MKERIQFKRAKQLANKIVGQLQPYCDRIEIAGSIRRKVPVVGDIEIVCIPKTIGESKVRIAKWSNQVYRLGHLLKGSKNLKNGKYFKIKLPEGINLDLFVTRPEIWGNIFLIRTGSADFAHRVLTEINKKGYTSQHGVFRKLGDYDDEENVFCYEEQDVFDLAGMPWVEPHDRIR